MAIIRSHCDLCGCALLLRSGHTRKLLRLHRERCTPMGRSLADITAARWGQLATPLGLREELKQLTIDAEPVIAKLIEGAR